MRLSARIASRVTAIRGSVCIAVMLALAAPAGAGDVFSVNNLITNDQTVNKAQIADPNLVNPWGVSFGPMTPLWVSNNGTGVASLYSIGAGDVVSIVNNPALFPVSIQGGGVTGQNFNSGAGSSAFNGDAFLFVTLSGAVEGWRPALGNTAEILVGASAGNSYTGSAYVTVGGNNYLLAANSATGNIDVIPGTPGQPSLQGNFKDPGLPTGFTPYNVQLLNGVVYVTYANNRTGGIVDAFTPSGVFVSRVATGGSLDEPWGLAIAPTSFGNLAGALLVGNRGSGEIEAFNLSNNSLIGTLNGANGNPLTMPGLWALYVGNDHGSGSSQEVYFAAGVGNYQDGFVGAIQLVPEPSTAVMGLIAAGLVASGMRWRSRRRGRAVA